MTLLGGTSLTDWSFDDGGGDLFLFLVKGLFYGILLFFGFDAGQKIAFLSLEGTELGKDFLALSGELNVRLGGCWEGGGYLIGGDVGGQEAEEGNSDELHL